MELLLANASLLTGVPSLPVTMPAGLRAGYVDGQLVAETQWYPCIGAGLALVQRGGFKTVFDVSY